MIELLRSNDVVLISFAESLLKEAEIPFFVADTHMSVLDGQVSILPRRLLVPREDLRKAQAILKENALGEALSADSEAHG